MGLAVHRLWPLTVQLHRKFWDLECKEIFLDLTDLKKETRWVLLARRWSTRFLDLVGFTGKTPVDPILTYYNEAAWSVSQRIPSENGPSMFEVRGPP